MSLHIGLHWRMAVGMAGNLWSRPVGFALSGTAREGVVFDRELAEQFEAPNRLLIEDGEEIVN